MTDTVDLLQEELDATKQVAKYCHDLIQMGREEEAQEKLYQLWKEKYPHNIEIKEEASK